MIQSIDSIQSTVDELQIDPDVIQKQVDQVLNDSIYWFPIRHHSLTAARYLEKLILTRKPKLILIEGPYESNPLIPYIVDRDSKPPIAIYSSYRDDYNQFGLAGIQTVSPDIPARFSCWFPFLSYSPEYVALKTAHKIKADSVFIDLPHYALIKKYSPNTDEQIETEEPEPDYKPVQQSNDEGLIISSHFYQKFTQLAGFKSWDETWDSLFEVYQSKRNSEDFRRDMAFFCACVRATTDMKRIIADGILEREAFMLKTIEQEIQKRALSNNDVIVVCGGFHIFADRHNIVDIPQFPEGTVYTTVVPYSFFRISELSGYSAGNRAPQYYQLLWEQDQGTKPNEAGIQYIINVFSHGRKQGESLSSADAISVTQTSQFLANLRGRNVPVLDDLHDALMTCCCKGNPLEQGIHLQKAIALVDIGNKIGRVTSKLTKLPVLSNFYDLLEELELQDIHHKDARMNLDLDKRKDKDTKRSIFLHRLRFLQVPIGEIIDANRTGILTGTLFKEKWRLKWSPKIEEALIEINLYGDSIETAALHKFKEELSKDSSLAQATCQKLIQAIDMDFPDIVMQVEEICGVAIDTDSHFASLSHALTSLLVLNQYALFRKLPHERLESLILRCFDRACFAIPNTANVSEESQKEVIFALLGLAEALQLSGRGNVPELDRNLFLQHLRQAALISVSPFMCGAFWGMLTELRELPIEELTSLISAYAKEQPDKMVQAGDFLDGLMSVCRTSIMVGAPHLIDAIDALLTTAEWDAFLIMLPKMRSAFERLHQKQRDTIAEIVAKKFGLIDSKPLTSLVASLGTEAMIARIDGQLAEIMKKWSFDE